MCRWAIGRQFQAAPPIIIISQYFYERETTRELNDDTPSFRYVFYN